MSRIEYVASKPISVLPLPRTRLLGKFFCAESYAGTIRPAPPPNGAHVLESNPDPHLLPVRVITSRKRRRTVAARLRSGVLELFVPATMPHAEREPLAQVMSRGLQWRACLVRPLSGRL